MQVEHSNSVMAERERRTPIGVEILAVLMVLAGVLFVIVGATFFISGPKDGAARLQTGILSAAWAGVDAAAGVIFLTFGALHGVLAIGLIRLRNAARILSILLFGMSATGACLGLTAALARLSYTALAWNVAVVAADAGALWYLLRPEVKEAFRS